LKADASLSFFRVESCLPTETICLGRSPTELPFFYMYSCPFSELHVSLPFDNFMMGALKALNVALTQLHPNTWVSIQAFHLICDVLCLHPTPSCFLSYYTSHPTEPIQWHSLIIQSGNILFSSYTTSYKNFKERFFKVFIRPKSMPYFFDEVGRSRFPMSWTRKPQKFKEYVRPWMPRN